VGSFLWFAYTTRPDILMFSLTQRGLSASLSYMIISTIQIIPHLQARTGAILDAQQARGLETHGNLPHRLRVLFPIVMPLILSSLLDVEERAVAIEARAFNYSGTKTSLAIIREARWEPVFRWILLLSATALVGFRLWFNFVYRQP
jgi:energy-coupling factor transport system permease protein